MSGSVALCYRCAMSQPVKLSDALVLDARLAAEMQERSIAGQVEFWAKLGRSIDSLLHGQEVAALLRTAGAKPLAELVEAVDTPAGREKLRLYLESEPFPHFEAHPTQAGLLIRTEENGERAMGRFVNREFVVESAARPMKGGAATRPRQIVSPANVRARKRA
jgi:hypothetical protein